MVTKLARYRKFIVAAIGFAVVVAGNHGFDFGPDADALIAALTAAGVFAVPNAPQPPKRAVRRDMPYSKG